MRIGVSARRSMSAHCCKASRRSWGSRVGGGGCACVGVQVCRQLGACALIRGLHACAWVCVYRWV